MLLVAVLDFIPAHTYDSLVMHSFEVPTHSFFLSVATQTVCPHHSCTLQKRYHLQGYQKQ